MRRRAVLRLAVAGTMAVGAVLSCGSGAPPPVAVVPPAASGSSRYGAPPRPAPRVAAMHEDWSHACAFVGGPGHEACELRGLDVAADGSVVLGGGAYAAVDFGGAVHPRRAYEQLVLAAFDPSGKPRWSKAWGTEWHNLVDDARFLGDGIVIAGVHANGFSADARRLPDRAVPGQDTAFDSETGFLASLTREGEVQWIENVATLAGAPPGSRAGVGIGSENRVIFPDRDGGFWFPYVVDAGQQIGHVVDRKLAESRPVVLPEKTTTSGAVITPDGDLLFVGETGTGAVFFRYQRQQVVATPLATWPVERGRTVEAQGRTLLAPDGTVYIVLVIDDAQGLGGTPVVHHSARLFHLAADGRVLAMRDLCDPVVVSTFESGVFGLGGAHLGTDGAVRVMLLHRGPIVVEGAAVPPHAFASGAPDPIGGGATLVTLDAGDLSLRGVAAMAPVACSDLCLGTARKLFAASTGVFALGGGRSIYAEPGCPPSRPHDATLARFVETR